MHKRDDIYNWRMSYEAWQTFNDLRQKGLFYDVTLVSEEGEKFQAHRIVLCSCGHYFRSVSYRRFELYALQACDHNRCLFIGEVVLDLAYTKNVETGDLLPANFGGIDIYRLISISPDEGALLRRLAKIFCIN